MKEPTSIKIEKSVRDSLRSQKKGGETYNELIRRMINNCEGNSLNDEI
jgi:predicted CopG family antitoxin